MTPDPDKVVDLHPEEWESDKHNPKALTMFWDFIGALIIGAGVILYKLIFG